MNERHPRVVQSAVERRPKLCEVAVESLIFKHRDLDAAGFGNSFCFTTFDLCSGSGRFHSSFREKRNALMLDAIELLDHLHDRFEIIVAGVNRYREHEQREHDCTDSLHRRPHFSLFFFVFSISRSGTPSCPSSLASLSRSTGPTMLTTVSSFSSV